MVRTINDLYQVQKSIWKYENEHFFGISPLDEWTNSEVIEKHLKECADKFWNNGTNELKQLFERGRCRDIDKLVPGSYELVFDSKNGFICLYATFEYDVANKDKASFAENSDNGEEKESNVEKKTKRSPLTYLPYPNDLCWFIGESEYVLRISANINYSLITRTENVCKYQKTWAYNIDKDEFKIYIDDFDPFEKLTKVNIMFLEACLGEPLTKENFKEALKSIPEFNYKSILYFKFGHVEEIFRMISLSSRFANPLMRVPIPINIVKMLTSQKNREDDRDSGSFNNLVLSNNKLFALENSRTIIYKSMYNSSFNFMDSDKVFDAFKTSTNKSAGRSRLILDDIIIKDNILYSRSSDGTETNMYELILGEHTKQKTNLSVLSCSRFSSNNDAKRIMMTAKLRAQAIPTAGEIDSFTHETPARIVFGDFEGFNYGDSIIISRSYAKKLESRTIRKVRINKIDDYYMLKQKYAIGDIIPSDEFAKIMDSTMCNNYRQIEIIGIDRDYLSVKAVLPFSIGDKITNLHGSKGIVSLIFEDEDMPYLKQDISEDFKAGPFDVIVSALSVYRRKSLGQLFEAWALATGHDDVNNIQDAVEMYYEDMQDFADKAIVVWHGKETKRPCGINMMIRLDHNAVSKQSRSYLKTNYARMLKIGEMELLNLASRNLFNIMNEIDIRSISKHHNSFSQIKEMQKTGYLKPEVSNNLRFFNILKTIGFDFNLRKPLNYEEINPAFAKLNSMLTDGEITLFDDEDDNNGEESEN